MGIVIGAVAVVFVLALIIFPGVRGKLKVLVGGFLNIFVEDIAKTPEGAKKVNYYTVSSRNVKDDVTGAWHKEPFYKTEDRLPLGHGEKSVIILQSFIKLTRDEIVAIRWHMGSFDCAVKGGDYGMGNAFETYPLAVMTHLADMEATYLVEGLAAK